MTNLCDKPLTKDEIADALNGAKLLLAVLDLEHNTIANAVWTAYEKWGAYGDIEINGRYPYKGGKLPIPEKDVQFIRVESFAESSVKGDIMYSYLSTDAHENGGDATKLLPETLTFDYYPWAERDDYISDLTIDECENILAGKEEIPTMPERVLITM